MARQIVVDEKEWENALLVIHAYKAAVGDLIKAADTLETIAQECLPHVQDKSHRFLLENHYSWLRNCCIRRAQKDLLAIEKGAFGLSWLQRNFFHAQETFTRAAFVGRYIARKGRRGLMSWLKSPVDRGNYAPTTYTPINQLLWWLFWD